MIQPVEVPSGKIKIDFDQNRMDSFTQAANNVLPWIQDVIEAYNLQGLEETVNMDAIKEMIGSHGPTDYIQEKALGNEVMMIGKVKVSRENAKAMLDLPNVHKLIKPCENLKHSLYTFRNGQYAGLEVFEIEKGKAVVSKKVLKEKEESFTTYAETEAEKEAWVIVHEIAERMEYLGKKYGVSVFDIRPGMGVLNQFRNSEDATVSINAYQLKRRLNKSPY